MIKPEVLLRMMPKIRHRSGHRLATIGFEQQYQGGLVMVDSEKWSFVDKDGFAEARPDQTGWSQVFAPPRLPPLGAGLALFPYAMAYQSYQGLRRVAGVDKAFQVVARRAA